VDFEHDGKPFTADDVRALCERGVSTKGAATVGFMGVGFKAVFRSFESVTVSSGDWRFKLQVPVVKGETFGDLQRNWIGAVLPHWDDEAEPPSDGMTCRFSLTGRLDGLPEPVKDFEAVLGAEQSLLPLLAWQRVREVVLGDEEWRMEVVPSATGGDASEVTADGKGGTETRRWVLFRSEYSPTKEAIARFLEHRQLSPAPDERERVYAEASRPREVLAFCPLDEAGDPVPPVHGVAFALLPTAVNVPLGLHLQADWLLVINRREIMQLEGNPWHTEIFAQVPKLIRSYLEWLVARASSNSPHWPRGYDALPGKAREDVPSDAWVSQEWFVTAAVASLKDFNFLPVPQSDRDGFRFEAPALARHLPSPLAKLMSREQMRQGLLFGGAVVSSRVLGDRASRWLDAVGLLQEMSPDELTSEWKDGRVGSWLAASDESQRAKELADLLEALGELDSHENWLESSPRCVPTEGGGWSTRDDVNRFPRDWAVLTNENTIREAIRPFAGEDETLVAWWFDSWLLQHRSDKQKYLADVDVWQLDALVTKWWESLGEAPSEAIAATVVAFTVWVRRKQSQRKGLVQRLLCVGEDGRVALLEPEACLLATPYASAVRNSLHPELPLVSEAYLVADAGSSAADWRSFFEDLDSPPVGRFELLIQGTELSKVQLEAAVGSGFSAPYRRATLTTGRARGLSFSSSQYLMLDWQLPENAAAALKNPVSLECSRTVAEWMAESSGGWRQLAKKRYAYVGYGNSYTSDHELNHPATWFATLTDTAWVFAASGEGPFKPCDILAAVDPARPEAPVAALPLPLVAALSECGVVFGSAIPNAPSIVRLKALGPASTGDSLTQLVEEAVNEAGAAPEKLSLLKDVFDSTPMFPLPPGAIAVDGAQRVKRGRLVQSLKQRSALSNWIVPIDAFTEGSPERRMLDQVASAVGVAPSPTANQAMDFLVWVWGAKPEAERVRHILPRAYQYVREGVSASDESGTRWKSLRENAEVFLLRERRWTRVSENRSLYLDDLRDRLVDQAGLTVELATPGHLGESEVDQALSAELLGVRLLSERYGSRIAPTGQKETPPNWGQAFERVQRQLKRKLLDRQESGEGDAEELRILPLSVWAEIHAEVLEDGTAIKSLPVRAAASGDGIAVAGEPAEFAEELCQVLFSLWGLNARRDLVDLLPKVAIQLAGIDRALEPDEDESSTSPVDSAGPSDGGTGPEEPSGPGQTVPVEPVPAGTTPPNPGEPLSPDEPRVNPNEQGGHPAPLKPNPKSRGHTSDDREARLDRLRKRIRELQQQEESLLAAEAVPESDEPAADEGSGEFQSDIEYRQAAEAYELAAHRFPLAKGGNQEGHDLDSYSHPEGHSERKLVRRIEVKGKGVPWRGSETVEMSDSQFGHAVARKSDGEPLSPDFDYWLYVVERGIDGKLTVLPIKNAARQTAKVEFRGGTWRNRSET